MIKIQFSHLLIKEHLGSFKFLAITKKAAMNVHIQVFV